MISHIIMSKARGASRSRSIRRGVLEGRPFNNKPAKRTKRKSGKSQPSFKYVDAGPTIAKSYERRVFPDKDGNLPYNAREAQMQYGGFHPDDELRYRTIWVVDDVKLVPPKQKRIELNTRKNY